MAGPHPNGDGSDSPRISRREFTRLAGLSAGGLASTALLAACGGASAPRRGSATAQTHAAPRRGGTLHAGFTGGSSSDTLDPLNQNDSVASAYAVQMFDSLVSLDKDAQTSLQLAQELIPSRDAKSWTIRLKRGITFHDGSPLVADDVIYTLRRIVNPKSPAVGAPQLTALDSAGLRKLDKYTVHVPFHTSYATFADALATYFFPIVPVGFDARKPIGTGPFMYERFTPGTELSLVRNPHYWQQGLPYVDRVTIYDVADETAQVNGLTSGQFDLVDYLSATSATAVTSNGGRILISNGGGWVPFTMRCDQAPFNDVRVRQAFRLLVDRDQLREVVFAGHGLIGNDLYAVWDPAYDHALPQRTQDIEQAKSLLKQAGRENLAVELVTSPVAQGAVQSATVLAQQAAAAGVKIKVRRVVPSDFFGPNYLKWQFAQDVWYYNPLFPQVALSDLPTSAFNETHFRGSRYTALYRQALATVDESRRNALAHEMQRLYHDQSGYIIPCFSPTIDGYGTHVGGAVASKLGLPFNNYDLKSLWLAE